MTTYEIHVLTGQVQPIKRVLKASSDDLFDYVRDFEDDRECSLIVQNLSRAGQTTMKDVFFGSKKSLVRKYLHDCRM